jgi:hypothetical protein
MRYRERLRPSPAVVVSLLALFLAIGGGSAIALKGTNSVDGGDLKKNSVKAAEIAKNAVRSGEVKNEALKSVDVLNNTLTGEDINEATVGPVDGDLRFSFNLSFGQSQQVAQFGPLSLTAECIQNTTDNAANANRDVARVLIATSENGSVFRSNEDEKNGATAADFLNTDTPPNDRVVLEASAPTGTTLLAANDDLFAAAPGGTRIGVPNETADFGVNLFGQNCVFTGEVENLG